MSENAVHLMSGVVTRLRVVEDHHAPARAQDERGNSPASAAV
jgi:hypothetical protein